MKFTLFYSLILVLILAPVSSRAANLPTQQGYAATYDVYAGGIHALQARLTYKAGKGRYEVSLASETYGLLDKLVPWHGEFNTKGWLVNGKRRPDTYISDTTFRGDRSLNTYRYGKDGQFLGFARVQNGKPQKPADDFDPSIAQGTIDMLTSTLDVMDQIFQGRNCDHSSKIFDSERSFYLNFTDRGKQALTKNDYNIFTGNSEYCAVEVKPDAGKWHKKPRGWLSIQEQGRKKGSVPVIWFGAYQDSAAKPVVPVKILLKTDYGTFFVHMTSFEEKPAG